MIILIGGVSCTGKTVMAQKLLEKYHIPYISIDHIKMGLIRGSNYCDFSATDDEDKLTNRLWPIVKGIIMTNIENKQHIIIEGCYLPPEQVDDFEPEYLEQIVTVYIGFSKKYLEKNFSSGVIEYRSEIEQRALDEYISQDNLIRLHGQLKERCENSNKKFFEIDEDYEDEMKNVYEYLDEQLQPLI